MNKQTRKELEGIFSRLEDIKAELEAIQSDEEEKLENTPDNLQGSQAYSDREECVETLSGIADDLQSACDGLEQLINN